HGHLLHPLKGPFVDSSNRTKNHSHLRSPPSKSPPTRTVSLAKRHRVPTRCRSNRFPSASFVPFPNVDFPASEGDSGECGVQPEPWRRPRARTSHVETPRRAQPQLSSRPSASKSRRPKTPQCKRANAAALADLRFTALIERSISQSLRERGGDELFSAESESHASQLDGQDELLSARLRASLARQGWRRPASPPRWTLPARPPSVLLSGSTGVSFPAVEPPAPQRFIVAVAPSTTSTRSRSGSRGSSSTATLPMPALVAALLLRRHNERFTASSSDTRVRTPDSARSTRRKSPLTQVASV
ncbi:hypothetical protein B0H17DRAFT_1092448, partial [Mycena rosella]